MTDNAQPSQTLEYSLQSHHFVYATFVQRSIAWLIDSLVVSVRWVLLASAMGAMLAHLTNIDTMSDSVRFILGLLMIAVIFGSGWLYYAISEASQKRATIGKRVVGIQVVDIEGDSATLMQTTARFVLRLASALTLGIGYLMVLFTKQHQTLHDYGANCIVIQRTL